MNTPLVSICSITYNHAPFIRQCLDGFLMQQCNFPIEIIINDDCSTDGTTEIIREYAEKYPDKIFPVFHAENQWSKGEYGIFQKFVFPKARGKYIALCEGDDYWTDPLKLQKQVDFLESHPDYSMCCHAATVKSSNFEYVHTNNSLCDCDLITRDVFLKGGCFIITNSIFFRKDQLNGFGDFSEGCPVGDYPLQIWCAMHGKVRHLKDVMSVYNHMTPGSWSISNSSHEKHVQYTTQIVNWLRHISPAYISKYRKCIMLSIGMFLLSQKQKCDTLSMLSWEKEVYRYIFTLPMKCILWYVLAFVSNGLVAKLMKNKNPSNVC